MSLRRKSKQKTDVDLLDEIKYLTSELRIMSSMCLEETALADLMHQTIVNILNKLPVDWRMEILPEIKHAVLYYENRRDGEEDDLDDW